MYSMSKKQMSQYLHDYAILCDLVIHNPKVPAITLFSTYMVNHNRLDDNTYEYYQRMIRTYLSYTYLKKFSIIEDYLLNRDDFLNNDDLKGLRNGIIELDCSNDISDKKIIQLIRNGFNHNDSPDFDRFRMSVNARRYEVEFKDLRTTKEKNNNAPVKYFRIKFSDKYLSDLYWLIQGNAKNVLIASYDIPDDFDYNSDDLRNELSRIIINRFYFTKKMDNASINKIKEIRGREFNTLEELKSIRKDFKDYVSSISDKEESYTLDSDQINTLYSKIDWLRKNNEFYLKYGGNKSLYYLINKVIPVPGFKKFESDNQLVLASFLMSEGITYDDILIYIKSIVNEEDKVFNDEYDEFLVNHLKKTRDKNELMNLYIDALDGKFVQDIPVITFIDSVICNICNDKTITIGGISYNKESIRNSLAHRRWFIDEDNRIVLYDADPKNINDNNLDLVGKIDLNDFVLWADNYYRVNDNLKYFKKR